jgi:curved DNA-binding protein CbpA
MPDIEKSFEELNVSRTASYDEAKAAYRELAIILHPDKHMQNERISARATEKFKRLQTAWEEVDSYYRTSDQIRRQQEEADKLRKEQEVRQRQEAEIFEARCKAEAKVQQEREQELVARKAKEAQRRRNRRIREMEIAMNEMRAEEIASTRRVRSNRWKVLRILIVYTFICAALLLKLGGITILIMPVIAMIAWIHVAMIGGIFGQHL